MARKMGDGKTVAAIVAIGAMTAMLGVLLNLLLGLSRVLLAMGRRSDMPAATANIGESTQVPAVATVVVAVLIGALVCIDDVKLTWSFSAFTVLLYYLLTNLCAIRLPKKDRL
jgi:APA family basic amino acid/polyamine antiporter